MSNKLRFREDGTFTIIQFTDIHWQDGSDLDRQTRAVMELIMNAEKPDFVMFTGDIIYTGRHADGSCLCPDPIGAFRQAVAAVEQRAIHGALYLEITIRSTILREKNCYPRS
jgi:predicted MPP superfamily phosphohydrolase